MTNLYSIIAELKIENELDIDLMNNNLNGLCSPGNE